MNKSEMIQLFHLEDNDALREILLEKLSRRGFYVISAPSIAEAERLLTDQSYLDVALLDNFLEDTPDRSGSSFGLELRETRYRNDPPETLVYSGEDHYSYYLSAIRLGAAGYLRKGDHGPDGLIAPLRALALRRRFRFERHPRMLQEINETIANTPHRAAALERLVEKVVLPQLALVMANPFYILVSGFSSYYMGSNIERKSLDPQLHRDIRPGEIVIWDDQKLSVSEHWRDPGKTVFINLFEQDHFKLSLGIVGVERNKKYPFPDDPYEMAQAIRTYVQPVLFTSLVNLVQLKQERERSSYQAVVDSSIALGSQLDDIVRRLERSAPCADGLDQLKMLVAHLQQTGVRPSTERTSSESRMGGGKRVGNHNTQSAAMACWRQVMGSEKGKMSWQGESHTVGFTQQTRFLRDIFKWVREKCANPMVTIEGRIFNGNYQLSMTVHNLDSNRFSRDSLFQPFQHLLESGGLLYEVANQVNHRGGCINDESDSIKGGSKFCLYLPLAPAPVYS